jgi:hypothetical protein
MTDLGTPSIITLREGKFDQQNGTSRETVKLVFQEIAENRTQNIVIHFHGGLVDRTAGVAGAELLNPLYRKANAYPVFFIWESGWKEILQQKIPAIFREDIFQKILIYLTRFAKAKVDKASETGIPRALGGLPLSRQSSVEQELARPANGKEPYRSLNPHLLPPTDALTEEERQQFLEKMLDDPQLDEMGQQIANSMTRQEGSETAVAKGANVQNPSATLMSPDVVEELIKTKEGAKAIFSSALLIAKCAVVLERIIQRFVQRRDHGFYLTIVEEILRAFYVGNAGKFLWDGMKQETLDAFGFDENLRRYPIRGAAWRTLAVRAQVPAFSGRAQCGSYLCVSLPAGSGKTAPPSRDDV